MAIDSPLVPFLARLAGDVALRDAFVAWLDVQITLESNIDRIDPTRTLDYQRGVVTAYRRMRTATLALERPKEN